jgi:large subunit ribosomal protein L30
MATINKLRVRLVKSPIGQTFLIKRTTKALGLLHLNDVIEQPDNPAIRGMLFKVRHLVEVEEVK